MLKNRLISRATVALLFLLTSTLTAVLAQKEEKIDGTREGYFTQLYCREHPNDMPRRFNLLIGEDGSITQLAFERYSSKSSGDYSPSKFDPEKYLGKVISLDFLGITQYNNKEFVYYDEDEMVIIPKSRINVLRDITVLDKKLEVDKKFQYPIADTLIIPHKVTAKHVAYSGEASNNCVDLTSYVEGSGTPSDPYTSADGTAGMAAAVASLEGKGGRIDMPGGHYEITKGGVEIPYFVSLKGAGQAATTIVFKIDSAWSLSGDNTIEDMGLDITCVSNPSSIISLRNGAERVTVRNIYALGDYTLRTDFKKVASRDIGTKNVILFKLNSYHRDLLFENNTFSNIFRSIVTKGQKEQHGITIRNCLFEGISFTPISLDQVSNITDVVVENNEFREFSHFGVAFARITNVTIRNNRFFSRSMIRSADQYNQAIHAEDYCQNFLIENNSIDVIMGGHQATRPEYRNSAISVVESRNATIRNNNILNSNIEFADGGNLARNTGHSLVENNNIDNGTVHIRSTSSHVTVRNNNISNAPDVGITILGSTPMASPCTDHLVENNTFTGLDNKIPFEIRGDVANISIINNSFSGENMSVPLITPKEGAVGIVTSGNKF